VDDNPSINRIVASLLSGTPTEVTYAKSASEALGLVEGEVPFDLALLDTSLPETDGWELLGRMRENPKAAGIPIAMMAGVLEDVDSARAESAPFQALLLKPVDFRDLPERLERLLAAKPAATAKPPAAPAAPSAPAAPVVPATQTAPAVPLASASLADPDILILEEQDLVADDAPGVPDVLGAPDVPDVPDPPPAADSASGGGDALAPDALDALDAPDAPDAPPPPTAADSVASGGDAFSLSLEDLNMGGTDEPPAAPAEDEAPMPLPDLEPPGGPSRENASDFIDTSPDDFTFGQADQGASGTGAAAVAADGTDGTGGTGGTGGIDGTDGAAGAAGGDVDIVPDGIYAALEKEFEAAPQPETAGQRPDAVAPPEHGEGGALGAPGATSASSEASQLTSSIESELLSDAKFIEAVARAVARAVAEKLIF
jgi:CheY-like chemotaxis protein